MASHGNSTRAIFFALGANLAIAIAKGVAAFFSGSSAMLAETAHSLADCGNQAMLLLGMKQAKAPPSPEYPLGFGRAIYFWSFLVAVMLFSVGGMFSLYEGIHKLSNPEPLEQWWWAVAVLVFSIAAEGTSLHACLREVNKARGNRSLRTWFHQTRQAELLVIFGEDTAALTGLSFALLAIVIAVATGNPMWDAIGTILIGMLLIVVAIFVAIEIKAMLIGRAVDPLMHAEMKAFLESQPHIVRVFNLIAMQLGDDVVVSVKARVTGVETAADVVRSINAAEAALKRRYPQVRWSFFEPDECD